MSTGASKQRRRFTIYDDSTWMSHVSRSEISTRRLPLNSKGSEQMQTSTGLRITIHGQRRPGPHYLGCHFCGYNEVLTTHGVDYSRAHDLRREFIPDIIMHEWHLKHVKIAVHVILPVCFEELWKDIEWSRHRPFSRENVPGTANANSSKSEKRFRASRIRLVNK